MQIEKNLPQFMEENALLIAAGKQTARFYRAGNGEIEPAGEIMVPRPKYSDNEGMFGRRGGDGGLAMRGGVLEYRDDYIKSRFLHLLAVRLREEVKRVNDLSVYFFLPEYMKGQLKRILPSDLAGLVAMELFGNYVKSHPFKLVAAIQAEQERTIEINVPSRLEAVKLLKK